MCFIKANRNNNYYYYLSRNEIIKLRDNIIIFYAFEYGVAVSRRIIIILLKRESFFTGKQTRKNKNKYSYNNIMGDARGNSSIGSV